MNRPQVYIVILNYKNWQDSRDCLDSLFRSTYTNFSVLLVDNNSGNDSLANLTEWMKENKGSINYSLLTTEEASHPLILSGLPKVVFFQNDKNEGFAAGNNLVLRLLQDENAYTWLLNPDMVVEEDTLEELVSFAERQAPDSIIGAEVRSYTGNRELFFYGGGKVNFASATVQMIRRATAVSQLDYISGGCLFTHAGNFKRLGLLPEEYFLYWEETDWCYRAKKSKYKLLVCPTAVCYDKISTVIGKGFVSDYYYARNGLLFISKYHRRNIPVVLVFMAIRYIKRMVTGQMARAKGVFRGTVDFFKMK